MEQYRCYFIQRDGRSRSVASVGACDPVDAVLAATARYPHLEFREVEVWLNSDRVYASDRGNIKREFEKRAS